MTETTPTEGERVVVGILTWNGYDLARTLLLSLQGLDAWPIPTIILDNGSEEPEGEALAAEFGSPVRAETLPKNELVAGGYNALIRLACRLEAEFVLLLNNDTITKDPHLIDLLLAAAQREPNVACVGPLVLDLDGSVFSAGGTIGRWSGQAAHLKASQIPSHGPYAVDWIDGPCMLVNLRVAREIGGLDPMFVATWEDVDWCVRARRSGYMCLIEPRASIAHARGATIPSSQSKGLALRNQLLFWRRNPSFRRRVGGALAFLIVTSSSEFAYAVKRRCGVRSTAKIVLSAIDWNIRDAVRRGWHVPSHGPHLCDESDVLPRT